MRGTYTYRRLLERFGFDCLRTSQLQKTISQRQSNGGCPLDVLYSLFLAVCACFCTMARKVRIIYLYQVGLSMLLVSTNRAMRRPSNSGTSNRTGSTFFVYGNFFVCKLFIDPSVMGAGWGCIKNNQFYEMCFLDDNTVLQPAFWRNCRSTKRERFSAGYCL